MAALRTGFGFSSRSSSAGAPVVLLVVLLPRKDPLGVDWVWVCESVVLSDTQSEVLSHDLVGALGFVPEHLLSDAIDPSLPSQTTVPVRVLAAWPQEAGQDEVCSFVLNEYVTQSEVLSHDLVGALGFVPEHLLSDAVDPSLP